MAEKVVKSVGRVFSILELFNRERRALTASDVTRELGYPHTSTVAILKSMEQLQYLSYERGSRTYIPSITVSNLVEWVATTVQQETVILRVMADLHEEIDETINLSRQVGDFIKIIHGLESTKLLGIRVREGVVMPMTASHTGLVALATYTDDEVAGLLRDFKKRDYPGVDSVTVEEVLRNVKVIREQRFSPGYDILVDGIGIIAFPLCSVTNGRPFVVAVAGPTNRIRENEEQIVRVAKRAINRHKARLAYPV